MLLHESLTASQAFRNLLKARHLRSVDRPNVNSSRLANHEFVTLWKLLEVIGSLRSPTIHIAPLGSSAARC